jgi:diguanylate cyclase (GGDEF)-like protein
MDHPTDLAGGGIPSPAPPGDAAARELARINRALRTLSAGNRTLLRAADEATLLHDMCRVIVEQGGYRAAAVGYAEHDSEKSIRWMTSVGADLDFLRAQRFTWADQGTGMSDGALATAIRTGQPSVARNLLSDPGYAGPQYADLRAHAIEHHYASATAFPLYLDGAVLGGLVMTAAEPDAFDQEEVCLLQEMADDLAYGIASLRTREQHRAAQATIERLAYYDRLTDLPNRTRLLQTLEGAMQAARLRKRSLALLHLEVGRFREINKVLGYHASDALLRALAGRLAQAVDDKETLARVGEAEFALLLPDSGAEYAIQVAQRLLKTLDEPVEVAGLMLDARVVIGIALSPGHATDAETLIRRANAAMHQTKHARGGYAMYVGGQEQENTRRLSLMGDLHRAIRQNELQLYCQPKVDMATRRVCGAEALVRWLHPQHGMVSTVEFIQLAEQAGTITPLTNWMLEAAFSQSYAWQEAGLEGALAVNLSAHDLYDPGFIDRIGGMFSTWGIAPGRIQFELTESSLMEDPAAALATLRRLKEFDVELYIDDYGTGYSSLSYLQKLPVDALKIDQSFVLPLMRDADTAAIVSSTIELGHNLGKKVVAEGVENLGIWNGLAALGCDVAQGYLISRPMPAEQFIAWEAHWHDGHPAPA